jgi:opacity protein-like surface antigen
MRKTLALLLLLLAAAPSLAAQAVSLERGLVRAVEELTAFVVEGRESSLKAAVALGDFTAGGQTAVALDMGAAVRDSLAAVLSRSNELVVAERANLDAILEEMELQLSGLTDEASAVKVGELLNAEAIFYGSVTERADEFSVAITAVRLESGQSRTYEFLVPRDDFVASAERRLDMLYVSPMGVGISLTYLSSSAIGDYASFAPFDLPDTTYFRRNAGVEVRYRVTDWLMVGTGIDWLYGAVWRADSISWLNTPDPDSSGEDPFTIYAEGFGIPINLYLVWNPVRWLSLDLRVGAEYCLLSFSGLFEPSVGHGFGLNDFGPLLQAELFAFAVQGGVEIFVTPRVALGLSAGYSFGGTDLATTTMWHLTNLPDPIPVSLEGFTYSMSVAFYF